MLTRHCSGHFAIYTYIESLCYTPETNIMLYVNYISIKNNFGDFPGGTVVKNLPANGGHGFNPWSGKIPHDAEQLSPCATTTEPAL